MDHIMLPIYIGKLQCANVHGAQTSIKTALWALSAIIFVIVIAVVVISNIGGKSDEER